MEEFRISAALVLLETGKFAVLDRFFSSVYFHEAVQKRRYMALAFEAYLQSLEQSENFKNSGFTAALTLEGALAQSRRELKDARRGWDRLLEKTLGKAPNSYYLCSPGVFSVEIPVNSLVLISKMEEYLFEASLIPALALCEDSPRPEKLPELDGAVTEHYLIEGSASGKVDFNKVEKSYGALIAECREARTIKELRRAFRSLGVSKDQLKGMISALIKAGVLREIKVKTANN